AALCEAAWPGIQSRACGLPSRSQGGVVVGLGRDLLDVLHVLYLAILPDDEDGARGQTCQRPVLDQDAVALGEWAVAEIGERLPPGPACRATPAFLCEGQILADRPDLDAARQLRRLFVEATGFGVADGRVERGNGADDDDLPLGRLEAHRL